MYTTSIYHNNSIPITYEQSKHVRTIVSNAMCLTPFNDVDSKTWPPYIVFTRQDKGSIAIKTIVTFSSRKTTHNRSR